MNGVKRIMFSKIETKKDYELIQQEIKELTHLHTIVEKYNHELSDKIVDLVRLLNAKIADYKRGIEK